MIGYRFLSVAEQDLVESMEFYESRQLGLAIRFHDELFRIILLLRNSPKIGTMIDDNFRSFSLDKFPFSIVYRLEEDTLIVVAVAHQSRHPNYWHDRIQ